MFIPPFLQLFYLVAILKTSAYIPNQNSYSNPLQRLIENPIQEYAENFTELMPNKKELSDKELRLYFVECRKFDFITCLTTFNELFYCHSIYSSSLCFEERKKNKFYKFKIEFCIEFMEIYAFTHIFSSNDLDKNFESDLKKFNNIMLEYKNMFSQHLSNFSDLSETKSNESILKQLLIGFDILTGFNNRILSFLVYKNNSNELRAKVVNDYFKTWLKILEIYNISTILFLSQQNINFSEICQLKKNMVKTLSVFNSYFILKLFDSITVFIVNTNHQINNDADKFHEEFINQYYDNFFLIVPKHIKCQSEIIFPQFATFFREHFEQQKKRSGIYKIESDSENRCFEQELNCYNKICQDFLNVVEPLYISYAWKYLLIKIIDYNPNYSIQKYVMNLNNQTNEVQNSFFLEQHKRVIEFLKIVNKTVLSSLPKLSNSSRCNIKEHMQLLDAFSSFIRNFWSYVFFYSECFYLENSSKEIKLVVQKNLEDSPNDKVERFYEELYKAVKNKTEHRYLGPKKRILAIWFQSNQNTQETLKKQLKEMVDQQKVAKKFAQETKIASENALQFFKNFFSQCSRNRNHFTEKYSITNPEQEITLEREQNKNIYTIFYEYFSLYLNSYGEILGNLKNLNNKETDNLVSNEFKNINDKYQDKLHKALYHNLSELAD
ncbi:hypothetical protein EDEG_03400 [Edhazardia aedis USNM 41457]|uniref:Uncharacterized protein n=1 Tax=Edhazardia aedis (strain USNM 41457) TaxID=1003232 RepID=J9D2X0_EDHAE|nr:hypothetical protein EDEG_03400 [Edhazardia aedis USNM 41457]|eukprot:EJW02156.1 hypothetical protein EDEG_03400 [Edhazardia aedis USNM 41457]